MNVLRLIANAFTGIFLWCAGFLVGSWYEKRLWERRLELDQDRHLHETAKLAEDVLRTDEENRNLRWKIAHPELAKKPMTALGLPAARQTETKETPASEEKPKHAKFYGHWSRPGAVDRRRY